MSLPVTIAASGLSRPPPIWTNVAASVVAVMAGSSAGPARARALPSRTSMWKTSSSTRNSYCSFTSGTWSGSSIASTARNAHDGRTVVLGDRSPTKSMPQRASPSTIGRSSSPVSVSS